MIPRPSASRRKPSCGCAKTATMPCGGTRWITWTSLAGFTDNNGTTTMRGLYLTNGLPFPLTSGYLRHYYFIQEPSPEHDITLLSMARPSFQEAHRDALAPHTQHIEVFIAGERGKSSVQKALHTARTLGSENGSIGA